MQGGKYEQAKKKKIPADCCNIFMYMHAGGLFWETGSC